MHSKGINYKGTGLGLPITKNIIELFGSTINLESDIGKGSTFSFNVSFDIDKEAIAKQTKPKPKTVALNGNYKILVAEDNKINQIVTRNILEKGNFQCDIAKNGLEAIKAMELKEYDLILMDINMPLLDGNEATREIRKTNTQIPIIALTAADIEEVKKDYKTIGYNDIITKPFDNTHFYQTILANIEKCKTDLNGELKLVKVSYIYSFLLIVSPSLIGIIIVSTRSSFFSNLLYSISAGVDVSSFLKVFSNTFPLHKTLSERIIPPGFNFSIIRLK